MIRDKDGMRINRAGWDECVPVHFRSGMYQRDLKKLRAGKHCLDPLIVKEVGEVRGKTLLHLQCHFGLDTLSWARLGAKATGLDFSPPAVELARRLSRELKLPARFICANVYDTPKAIRKRFDIVFTSIGAICWLPDLGRWAEVAARMLKRGGMFYLMDIHPFSEVFDNDDSVPRAGAGLRFEYNYFGGKAIVTEEEGTYAAGNAKLKENRVVSWNHPLSEVVNALIGAGLRIEAVNEYPHTVYRQFRAMKQTKPGRYELRPGLAGKLPLLFSVRARK